MMMMMILMGVVVRIIVRVRLLLLVRILARHDRPLRPRILHIRNEMTVAVEALRPRRRPTGAAILILVVEDARLGKRSAADAVTARRSRHWLTLHAFGSTAAASARLVLLLLHVAVHVARIVVVRQLIRKFGNIGRRVFHDVEVAVHANAVVAVAVVLRRLVTSGAVVGARVATAIVVGQRSAGAVELLRGVLDLALRQMVAHVRLGQFVRVRARSDE